MALANQSYDIQLSHNTYRWVMRYMNLKKRPVILHISHINDVTFMTHGTCESIIWHMTDVIWLKYDWKMSYDWYDTNIHISHMTFQSNQSYDWFALANQSYDISVISVIWRHMKQIDQPCHTCHQLISHGTCESVIWHSIES